MSRDAAVTFTWADGDYTFRLKLGQLRELQEKCNAGPAELYNRCVDQRWRIDDLRETIRLGLIGGGTSPEKAITLINRYFDERPLAENIIPATTILGACLIGTPDEPPGKAQAAKVNDDQVESSPTGSSPLPQSTEQEQS